MSLEVQTIPAGTPIVRPADRALDVAAAILISAGVGLFYFARQALKALANGTYSIPGGVTWVSRAELHDLQSRVGLWVTALGVLMALVAFGRHALRQWPSRSPARQVDW